MLFITRSNGSAICEDQGVCKCGQCQCYQNYGGRFCECNNNMCINKGSSVKCSGRLQNNTFLQIQYSVCVLKGATMINLYK